MLKIKFLVLLAAICLTPLVSAFGWDDVGHKTIAYIAWQQMTTPAREQAIKVLRGAPEDFILPVREVRLSAGAGFVVAICGDIMTMPGLPRVPSSERIRMDINGRIAGLS